MQANSDVVDLQQLQKKETLKLCAFLEILNEFCKAVCM